MGIIFDRFHNTPAVADSIKKTFGSYNYNPNNRYHLVIDGVAVAGVDIVRTTLFQMTGKHAMLYCLEVYEPFRNMGYGKMLLQQAELLCRGEGTTIIGLNVDITNTYAIQLYTGCGFQIIKELAGTRGNEHCMRKFFDEEEKVKYFHPSRFNPYYNH